MQADSKASIRNVSLINNIPPALYISGCNKVVLTNISLLATTDSVMEHIRLEGRNIFIKWIRTNVAYSKSPQSNLVQSVMRLTAYPHGNIISNDLSFDCSRNFYVDVRSMQVSKVHDLNIHVKCSTCSPNDYTLTKNLRTQNISKTAKKEGTSKCKPCPSGAICNGDIKALDGYWGTKGSSNDLVVFPCPKGYCCSSQTTPCVSYDTCLVGRGGTLCGHCAAGFVQSFLSDGCISKSSNECNLIQFMIYVVIVSWVYTFVFALLPAIVEKLKKIRNEDTPNKSSFERR